MPLNNKSTTKLQQKFSCRFDEEKTFVNGHLRKLDK